MSNHPKTKFRPLVFVLILPLLLCACGGGGGGGSGGAAGVSGGAGSSGSVSSAGVALSQVEVKADGSVGAPAINCGQDGCSGNGYLEI